ncbi:TetR/AcrR family transcriptional regulator [Bacillus horti]|uniref:AcrR family transcriptional regulator n=1 Tax=Caldalkalibacillus horti TaxID=77523 RepID=A0ABT9VXI8_9BACI|nr:TetR/AcrR family transcriptional regulator [Bacillus horti]MDQ0165605.1 AcrR family transcriptional regulator [Bacillus horti]
MSALGPDQRKVKGEQTKNKILNETIQLIALQGLKEVSTAKIADRSSISKSTIFHHFKTTDDILLATLDLLFEELYKSFDLQEHQNVEQFLSMLGDSLFGASKSQSVVFRAFFCFLHEGLFQPSIKKKMLTYSDQTLAFFVAQLTKYSPEASKETIHSVAVLLLPLLDGLGLHSLLYEDSERFEKAWSQYTNSIITLLSK